jgi:hypothetical protein
MKKMFFLVFILIGTASYGQTLKKLKVFCKDNFDPRASITVEELEQDPVLAVDALKNNLVINGFKVISERVAKEKFEINNNGTKQGSSFNQDLSAGVTTYMKSVYVITLVYSARPDTGCGGVVMSNLSGQIVDLANDGEIVATFSFNQNGLEGKCTSKVMESLAVALKEKQKIK